MQDILGMIGCTCYNMVKGLQRFTNLNTTFGDAYGMKP